MASAGNFALSRYLGRRVRTANMTASARLESPHGAGEHEARRNERADTAAPGPVGNERVGVQRLVKGGGERLPETLRTPLERRLGADLGAVRVHTNRSAAEAAASLQAEAFTVGQDIVFGAGRYRPGTETGRQLLAHEATHAVQQQGATPAVQRRVDISDVRGEMVGRRFKLRVADGGVPAGTEVTITDWKGSASEADVSYTDGTGSTATATVKKRHLEPVHARVAGVTEYTVGLSGQRTAVSEAEQAVAEQRQALAEWNAKESSYKTNREAWEAGQRRLTTELTRREGVLTRKDAILGDMLVRQTMYNRFDAMIKHWVDFYNAARQPDTDLDPNIVKSMFYQESRLGTSGVHLQLGPYDWTDIQHHPIKSRFNLGQAIDSWGPIHFLMIKEMDPALYAKHGLDALEAGNRWNGMSNADLMSWNGGALVEAIKELYAKRVAGNNLMGKQDVDLYLDYEFWIRTAIRWLFHKYESMSSPSWSEAVRAYNGGGADARAYRDAVMGRRTRKPTLDVGVN